MQWRFIVGKYICHNYGVTTMPKSYKDFYDEIIGTDFKAAVIEYNSCKKTHEYRTYSHHVGEKALDDLVNLIIDDIVFYSFSEDEVLKLNEKYGLLTDLRLAAKYAYSQRLPKRENPNSDGLMGEVLLDIFIMMTCKNAKKLIARAKFIELGSKKEIVGYDALYFTKSDDEISLWLGQAKAGQKRYCKDSIAKDLEEKYEKKYFADTMFYVVDKSESHELEDILSDMNGIIYKSIQNNDSREEKAEKIIALLKDKEVTIKIPCLISYTSDIYNDKTKLKVYIENEIEECVKDFESRKFLINLGLECEIIFYILPVKDVDYIRKQIVDLKKEVK